MGKTSSGIVAEERVADVFDGELASPIESHRHCIEAELGADSRMGTDPGGRGPAHLPSLGPGDRFQRMLGSAAASLHLDERHDSPFQRYDVQLPASGAPVASQDLEAARSQVADCDILTASGQAGGREELR